MISKKTLNIFDNTTNFHSQACNYFQIEITAIILKLSHEGATLSCQEVGTYNTCVHSTACPGNTNSNSITVAMNVYKGNKVAIPQALTWVFIALFRLFGFHSIHITNTTSTTSTTTTTLSNVPGQLYWLSAYHIVL